MLVPAMKRVISRLGRVPSAVTADRGYGEAKIDSELEELGVTYVAIPRKGKPSAARAKLQRSARFTKLVKWRTGSEGRISSLKRNWGWGRTLMDGIDGTTTWCGWAVLSHNSFKIASLTQQTDAATPRSTTTRPPRPTSSDPPTPAPFAA
jgi:IS5 family transposase